MDTPIWIGVGGCEAQRLPFQVLAHSIKRRTTSPVEVVLLGDVGIEIPVPEDSANRSYTSFSFQRFTIPQWRGYQGRAIYLDSDMLVLADIAGLWELPMQGHDLLTVAGDRDHFSVLLLDCEKLGRAGWTIKSIITRLDTGEFGYRELMFNMPVARWSAGIPAHWNRLDSFQPGQTSLLHYTRLRTQPWLSADHPWASLWVAELLSAMKAGEVTHKQLQRSVDEQQVRPSLLYQVESLQLAPEKLPEKVLTRDAKFSRHCERHKFVLP